MTAGVHSLAKPNMARGHSPMLCAVALLLLHASISMADNRANGCFDQVPDVDGLDQEPSNPAVYGKCTAALDRHVLTMGSNWCAFNDLGYW